MHMFSITEICVYVSATVCRCGEGRYLCGTSNVWVDRSSVCDGSKDCPDGGDKTYCRKSMFYLSDLDVVASPFSPCSFPATILDILHVKLT